MLGQVLLMAAVGIAAPLAGADPRAAPTWLSGLALALLGLGAAFGLGGVWALGRHRTIFPQPKAHARLITHGVYGWVRHPLYTSLILIALGWSALWRSWLGLVLATALSSFLHRKARREEQWLRAKFPNYEAYARRVKRLIPGLY